MEERLEVAKATCKERLRLALHDYEKVKNDLCKNGKQLARSKTVERSLDMEKVKSLKRRLGGHKKEESIYEQENNAFSINLSLSTALSRIEELSNENEKLRLKVEQNSFELELKSKDLEALREKKLEQDQRISHLEASLKQEKEQRCHLRQRVAIYRERANNLKDNNCPQVLKEKYQEEMKNLELKHLKKESLWRTRAQQALASREEGISKMYQSIAETAIETAKNAMDEHIRKVRQSKLNLEREIEVLRKQTIPLELHETLMKEQKRQLTESARFMMQSRKELDREINKYTTILGESELERTRRISKLSETQQELQDKKQTIAVLESQLKHATQREKMLHKRMDALEDKVLAVVQSKAIALERLARLKKEYEADRECWKLSSRALRQTLATLQHQLDTKKPSADRYATLQDQYNKLLYVTEQVFQHVEKQGKQLAEMGEEEETKEIL